MKTRRNKLHLLPIILLALIVLLAVTAIVVIIYLSVNGLLEATFSALFAYFNTGGRSTIFFFWALLLPLLLIAFLIFMLLRKKRVKKVAEVWEAGMDEALRNEREKLAAARDTVRFTVRDDSPNETFDEIVSPAELCTRFRAFAAGRRLYFGLREIRGFIAGLATSHLLLLQGASGTGKTSLPYAFGQFLQTPATVIPVQPTWKERADLIGYYNEFTKKYNETPLFKKIYEAGKSDKMYLVVLDEMNLARVEYYFAEFLSLMEIPDPELRLLPIVPDARASDPQQFENGALRLPENIWFVGTVDGEAQNPISDKVFDRAMVLTLGEACPPFAGADACACLSYAHFAEMVAAAERDFPLPQQFAEKLAALDATLIRTLRLTFGNRIRKQIGTYLSFYAACGGDRTDALDDILSAKILRKLEAGDTGRIRGEISALMEELTALFGAGRMEKSRKYLAALCGREV